jgi:hypothetical protein
MCDSLNSLPVFSFSAGKSFTDPNSPCFIFVAIDDYEKTFPAIDELGVVEFLRALCAHQSCVVLVLPT